MRDYELALVLTPDLAKEAQEKILAKIGKLTTELGGKLEKADEWGKRALAYPIKKQKEGVYFLLRLEIEAEKIREVQEKLKLEEAVLRHLLLRKE